MLDPVILSRLQYAWVIAWHILLPAITVGLGSYIAFVETLSFVTKDAVWLRISNFWTRIFAVAFGMGVVSGMTLPFQFGTNWSRFSDATANVISPLLAYEGLTAFFLEAGFLGVLLFGRRLVPRWAHLVAALMVAAGTLISTFWIIAVNSWMQTPTGYEVIDGRFFPRDWAAVIFSPSFPYRLAHSIAAFYITTGFVVLGVGAWLLRRGRFAPEARRMVSSSLWLLLGLVPLQFVLGDAHGLNTLERQPAKLAAIEARWDTGSRVPLTLFAIPDQAHATNHMALDVPVLGSLILTHDPNGTVKGLKAWPPDQWPPVLFPFFAFRIMVGLGVLMLVAAAWGNALRFGGRLYRSKWFLRIATWASPIGFLAVIAGWVTTETGRQPWTVYGLMRTSDSVTPSLSGASVLASLIAYVVVYLMVYPAGLVVMAEIVRRASGTGEAPSVVEGQQRSVPVRAADSEGAPDA
ncbi:MAG TPA: cytochrome ubiquinol oxidase subunit I [Caulobacteraceae bacterium]|nr:cytochrome ubiquinol oxidase subunit I [Caulobacteraceae bacterium]